MFALLSTLCQSPIYWYTSGPSQKYILRQIKAIDSDYMNSISRSGDSTTENTTTLDICLLMLYGHILFTSTSYTYALGSYLVKSQLMLVYADEQQAIFCAPGLWTLQTPW
jgi:general transcription factor 3C polypeptide 3 (transcription factor C subunit 4)